MLRCSAHLLLKHFAKLTFCYRAGNNDLFQYFNIWIWIRESFLRFLGGLCPWCEEAIACFDQVGWGDTNFVIIRMLLVCVYCLFVAKQCGLEKYSEILYLVYTQVCFGCCGLVFFIFTFDQSNYSCNKLFVLIYT